jgi:hypothetical protein
MTAVAKAARERVRRLTLADVGVHLNTAADWFLALFDSDAEAARQSLQGMPLEPNLKQMLCLAVDTVVDRRQRRIDYELDGFRIRWPGR